MDIYLTKREKKFRFAKPWITITYFCIPTILIMVIQGLYDVVDKTLALQFATGDLSTNGWYVNAYNALKGLTGIDKVTSIPINDMRTFINIGTQYGYQVYNLQWAFSVMIGLGCALNFSMAYGRRDKIKMRQITGNGFALTSLFGLLVGVIMFCLIYPGFKAIFITVQMGNLYNPITQQIAWQYCYPMIVGAPMMFLSYYVLSLLRSEGRSNLTIMMIVSSLAINIGSSIFFMTICHLGMVGSMLGTVVAWICQVMIGLIIIVKMQDSKTTFGIQDVIKIDKSNLLAFMKLGFPNFLANGALVFTSFISTILIVQLPNQDYENHVSILQQLMSSIAPWMILIVSVGAGITQGARSIIAYNYGAKKYNRIWQILKRTSTLLIIWFSLMLIVFISFGKEMMEMFAFPANYSTKYQWWLVLNFMSYPFCAVTYICLTLFQGTNKSLLATISNSLRTIVVALPCIGIGFVISMATGNAIYYYGFIGLTDLFSAAILIPILVYKWKKHRNNLIDVTDNLQEQQFVEPMVTTHEVLMVSK
ncbi:MATE family efflux transporter [Spiroplasma endosymbiont of Nebria brevicollis]|uniref:MATE family efflux transporter n=1 Tax=Spiroplasma endosymbiont of Nebria brevicollis TaxID=3066284 RepID=UPI00313DCB61